VKIYLDVDDYGGTNDLLNFNGEQVDEFTTIKFQRRLDTGNKFADGAI
jgi:hypothetical protein